MLEAGCIIYFKIHPSKIAERMSGALCRSAVLYKSRCYFERDIQYSGKVVVLSWYEIFEPNVGLWEARRDFPKLIAGLTDRDLEVRCLSYDALGRLGGPEGGQAILKFVQKEEVGTVRCRATVALGRVGSQEATDMLYTLLNDEDWEVRSAATQALGRQKRPELLPTFCLMLQDEHEAVVAEAIHALSYLGNYRANRYLHSLFDTCGKDVRELASAAINAINLNQPMDWPEDEVYFFTYTSRGRFVCECYSYKLVAWRNYLRRRWRFPFARDWGVGFWEIKTLAEHLTEEVMRPGFRLELCDRRA
jgi:hypothetical protein